MTRTAMAAPLPADDRSRRLNALGLRGVVEHLEEFEDGKWLPRLIEIEEADRAREGRGEGQGWGNETGGIPPMSTGACTPPIFVPFGFYARVMSFTALLFSLLPSPLDYYP